MRKQRNMLQIKEQKKTPQKVLNETEASNLRDTELKKLVVRGVGELKGRINNLSENFNKEIVSIKKDIGTIKKNQSETKTTITEIKITLEEIKVD